MAVFRRAMGNGAGLVTVSLFANNIVERGVKLISARLTPIQPAIISSGLSVPRGFVVDMYNGRRALDTSTPFTPNEPEWRFSFGLQQVQTMAYSSTTDETIIANPSPGDVSLGVILPAEELVVRYEGEAAIVEIEYEPSSISDLDLALYAFRGIL